MSACLAAKDPVFVLNGQHVDMIDIQEIRRSALRAEVTLGNLKPNTRRIRVPSAGIVHREHERVDVRQRCRQRVCEVRRERGNSALTRQVIAKDGESLHSRGVVMYR